MDSVFPSLNAGSGIPLIQYLVLILPFKRLDKGRKEIPCTGKVVTQKNYKF